MSFGLKVVSKLILLSCILASNSEKEDQNRLIENDIYTINKLVLNRCLKGAGLNQNSLYQLNDFQKHEVFLKGKCPPIILVPGFIGTKLNFQMKNCELFRKHHKDIMDTCGWTNCNAKELQNFQVWVNIQVDLSSIFGGENVKKEHIPNLIHSIETGDFKMDFPHKKACYGHLIRKYFEKSLNGSIKSVSLKGAEINFSIKNKKDCGADAISHLAHPILSSVREFQNFSSLISVLNKMGYKNGFNLFNFPYDFRQSINKISKQLTKTIETAYKLNKKKVLIISHSYGGLVTYKSLQKAGDLVERVIYGGTPFLGSKPILASFLSEFTKFNIEKKTEIMGMDIKIKTFIEPESKQLFEMTFGSMIDLLPRFFLTENNDNLNLIIKELIKIESEMKNVLYTQENSVEEAKIIFDKLIESSSFKNEILKFYRVFKLPYETCKMPLFDKDNWSDSCKINGKERTRPIKNIINSKAYELENLEELKEFYNQMSYYDYKLMFSNKSRINRTEFIDYLFSKLEKFDNNYKYNNISSIFIFGSHIKVPDEFEIKNKNIENLHYVPGDSTVDTISQIYPGLRWFFEDRDNSTIHFAEYCSLNPDNSKDILNLNEDQHLRLGCDCLDNPSISLDEYCVHATLFNDNRILRFISNVIFKSQSNSMIVKGYENLFNYKIKEKDRCSNFLK